METNDQEAIAERGKELTKEKMSTYQFVDPQKE
jgi:hypothetical protein